MERNHIEEAVQSLQNDSLTEEHSVVNRGTQENKLNGAWHLSVVS